MSMRSLESAVLAELRFVTRKSSIRLKDILQWSTGDVEVREGESEIFLPDLKIKAVVKTELLGVKR